MGITTASQHEDANRPTRRPASGGCRLSPSAAQLGQQLRLEFTTARPGDHHAIHQLLLEVFQRPSSNEFHCQLEDPLYEPADRIVVRRGEQLLGHARLARRDMRYGPSLLPVAVLHELAVAPAGRHQGIGTALLETALRTARAEGAVAVLAPAESPGFLGRHGWVVCTRPSYSLAGPREILSLLNARGTPEASPLTPPAEALNIRLWRHVEQAALERLYLENTATSFGPPHRSSETWRWLLGRRGYERIYVAISGPDKLELDETLSPIVGYAVTHEDRIVELMVASHHDTAAVELLARACGDAIERDFHPLRLDAPPDHPLHGLFVDAGGRHYRQSATDPPLMVKLFQPAAFLAAHRSLWHAHAKRSLGLPCELGIHLEGEKFRLLLGPRGARLERGRLGRSYLACDAAALTQLMLGDAGVQTLVKAARIEASTRIAEETATAVFPPLPLWRPPLDDLPA